MFKNVKINTKILRICNFQTKRNFKAKLDQVNRRQERRKQTQAYMQRNKQNQ